MSNDYNVGDWLEVIAIPDPDDGTTPYVKGKIVAVNYLTNGITDTTVVTLQQWPNDGPGWANLA